MIHFLLASYAFCHPCFSQDLENLPDPVGLFSHLPVDYDLAEDTGYSLYPIILSSSKVFLSVA